MKNPMCCIMVIRLVKKKCLFSLDQNNIEKNIYTPTGFYTPFYWYLVLSDSLHNRKFEWNAYSRSEDEYAGFCIDVISEYVVYLMNITR